MKTFLQEERYRALFVLVSCCIPMCIEILVGGVLHTPMSWHCIVIASLYTVLAFKATAARCHKDNSFIVYSSTCHSSLCILTVYAWLSLFTHIYNSTIACMMPDTETSMDDMLQACQKGGLVRDCTKNIHFLNKITSLRSFCPQDILGHHLGTTYIISVYIFRIIICGIYGMWNLYTWNTARFETCRDAASIRITSKRLPPFKRTLFFVCATMVCCLIEASVLHIQSLSSFEVVLPHVFGFCLYHTLKTKRMADSSKDCLYVIKKTVLVTGMVYATLDFIMNSTGLIFRCFGNDMIEKHLKDTCKDVGNPSSVNECYSMIENLDNTYFTREFCPSNDLSTAVLYIVNIVKVLLLTIGTAFLYATKKHEN